MRELWLQCLHRVRLFFVPEPANVFLLSILIKNTSFALIPQIQWIEITLKKKRISLRFCVRNLWLRWCTYPHSFLEAMAEAVKDATGLLQLEGAFIFTEEFNQGLASLPQAFHLFLSFHQPHFCSLV